MKESEIKNKLFEIFLDWMRGQTVGTNPDGSIDYYECDVDAFISKIKTGYDRQADPEGWD